MPPNPQFWGNKNFKVPHFTPKLGGHGGRGFRGLNNHKTKIDRTCVYTVALISRGFSFSKIAIAKFRTQKAFMDRGLALLNPYIL
jgi:hypothetical protein